MKHTTTAEDRLVQLLFEAERLDAALTHFEWDCEMWKQQHPNERTPDWQMERDPEIREPLESTLDELYLATLSWLEQQELRECIKQFYRRFNRDFDATRAVSERQEDREIPYVRHGVFLRNLQQFLRPLGIDLRPDRYRLRPGVRNLEYVLDNTAALLHRLRRKPRTEADVYRPVREILKLMFESARNPPAGRFSQELKYYKPDILIPDLSAAVEYKYIRTMADLTTALAGIADDVKGYSGDSTYKLFYAVFYFANAVIGQKQFNKAWKERAFPDNWLPVFVSGT